MCSFSGGFSLFIYFSVRVAPRPAADPVTYKARREAAAPEVMTQHRKLTFQPRELEGYKCEREKSLNHLLKEGVGGGTGMRRLFFRPRRTKLCEGFLFHQQQRKGARWETVRCVQGKKKREGW